MIIQGLEPGISTVFHFLTGKRIYLPQGYHVTIKYDGLYAEVGETVFEPAEDLLERMKFK